VSAGIDMGLTLSSFLVNDDVAKMVQLSIAYNPQAPYETGAPSKVSPHLLKATRRAMGSDYVATIPRLWVVRSAGYR
jgi:cyclohexyl-isocyanide hydratase